MGATNNNLPVGNEEAIDGNATNDTLVGGIENSTLNGGDGRDILIGDSEGVLQSVGRFTDNIATTGTYGYTNTNANEFGVWTSESGGYTVLEETDYGLTDTGRGQVLEVATDQHARYSTDVEGFASREFVQLSLDVLLPDHNRFAGVDGVNVYWNDVLVLSFSPDTKEDWYTVTVGVRADSDGTNELTLEGFGYSNYHGAVIDNVEIFAATETGGNDMLIGGDGNDRLFGNGGRDWLNGGTGRDRLDGGDGVDTASYIDAIEGVSLSLADGRGTGGEADRDTYTSIENARGSNFADVIEGDENTNRLVGADGDDALYGLGGNDTLIGGRGADFMDGGEGDRDVVEYDWSTSGVNVNLLAGSATGGFAEGDTLLNIEYIYGSHFDDVLIGDNGVNRIVGNCGDDVLYGMGGNDILVGGHGAETLMGGEGDRDAADYQSVAEGVTLSLITGGTGGFAAGDTYNSVEFVYGSDHNDSIEGDNGINRLVGNEGDDVLSGMGGNDYILGGAGNDTMTGGAGDDVFQLANNFGDDVITDFEAGAGRTDRVWFKGMGLTEADLTMTDTADGVVIDAGTHGTLTLAGATADDLVSDDFIF